MDAPDERNSSLESKTKTSHIQDDQKGVKVYDPPAPRSFAVWLMILVLVLALITTGLIFQALR
jgi:hypothetical protein